MLLTNKIGTFDVQHTSKCIIHTKGVIRDGDVISVSSPIFSSTNLLLQAINMSDTFDVSVRLMDPSTTVENNLPDGEFFGTLVCDDNDIFNMYVRL
jgi:hypothetical protein